MKFNSKEFDWYSLITAIIMLAVGIVVLIWPAAANRILAFVLAALVLIAGMVRTFFYFYRHESTSPFSFGGLTLGLTLLAVGLFLLLQPEVLIAVLPVILGCMLVFTGFGSLQTGFSLMRLKINKWFIPLIFALAALICGFLALFNSFGTANVLMVFLGISIVVEGVLQLVSLYLFRKNVKGIVVEAPTNPNSQG